jgi:hypothetical protein
MKNKTTKNSKMSAIGWRDLREPFDKPLPRVRAISLRGGASDLSFLSLCSQHDHGYAWQGPARRISHSYEPDFQFRISNTFYGSPNGVSGESLAAMKDFPRFVRNQYGPDIIERTVEYPVLSVGVEESVFRTLKADYVWSSTWFRNAYRVRCPLRMELVINSPEAFERQIVSRKQFVCLMLQGNRQGDLPLHLAIGVGGGVTVDCIPGADKDSLKVGIQIDFGLCDSHDLRIALSCRSKERALSLLNPKTIEQERIAVEQDWDRFFSHFSCPKIKPCVRTLGDQLAGSASLRPRDFYLDHEGNRQAQAARPPVDSQGDLTDDDYRFAYTKGLWHSRTGERVDPVLGASWTEAFNCYYNGTFAWSIPAAGFYLRSHPDPVVRRSVRESMEGYRKNQRADGWLPCYIPFNYTPEPGGQASVSTQIPQYAWGLWQEYLHNRDKKWIAGWYEPLCRYERCMRERDASFFGMGLWCQTHYYDGIDMFPTVDGLVIRKDPVLYSAVYAGEQVRYLDVLARIARVCDPSKVSEWENARDTARRQMEKILWDPRKQWYGDVLANRKRETVIGISGLFAAAYGLLPAACDRRKVRDNLESLITPYGAATVAPRDRRYTERFFWRGPVWPASCLYTAAAAQRYAPDLLPRIAAATVRFSKAQPSVWECLEPHSGEVARYDEGVAVMPGILASVVGAAALSATLRVCAGENLFSLEKEST